METIGKIRRRRLVQGESISAIARDLRLSRNTVKRALRVEGEVSLFAVKEPGIFGVMAPLSAGIPVVQA